MSVKVEQVERVTCYASETRRAGQMLRGLYGDSTDIGMLDWDKVPVQLHLESLVREISN
jgi:hypothetical protein